MNGFRQFALTERFTACSPSPARTLFSTRGISMIALALALAGVPQKASAEEAGAARSDGAAQASPLIPLLMASPERRQLAFELERAIREGRMDEAERRLNAAIETGTLAIVLSDRLQDPGLLATLQSLGLTDEHRSTSARDRPPDPAVQACPAPAASSPFNAAEMVEALEREQVRANEMAMKLSALTNEYHNLRDAQDRVSTSATEEMSRLQEELQREREKSQSIQHELANARQEFTALKAAYDTDLTSTLSQVGTLEQQLQQERERSNAVTEELLRAKEHASALQERYEREMGAKDASLSGLRDVLLQEQARGDALTAELASAIDDVRKFRDFHENGPTPMMFLLEASGAPGPIQTEHDRDLVRTVQSVPIAAPARLPAGDGQDPSAQTGATARVTPTPVVIDDRLVARADALFRSGDVSGARLLLERSMETGNPRAAFLLAETFDPHVLSRIGVVGIRGDVERARELYARALSFGVPQAESRLQALK